MKYRAVTSGIFSTVMILAALIMISSGSAIAGKGAGDFVRSVGQQALNSLTSKELTDDQRRDRFRVILNQSFGLPLIARYTLGRYWRKASAEQRKEYTGLFEEYIVRTYTALFRNYNGQTLSVGKVTEINKSDVAVKSELAQNDGEKIVVYWRVRGKSDLKIIDVNVEGVSLVITQRDEFSSIIKRNGGTVEGLLTALRKKMKK
jgi:phospholipid transport system substrate-binding protein